MLPTIEDNESDYREALSRMALAMKAGRQGVTNKFDHILSCPLKSKE